MQGLSMSDIYKDILAKVKESSKKEVNDRMTRKVWDPYQKKYVYYFNDQPFSQPPKKEPPTTFYI